MTSSRKHAKPRQKCKKAMEKQGLRRLTSDSNYEATSSKRKRKAEKLKPDTTKKVKAVPVAQSSSDEDDPVTITESEDAMRFLRFKVL
jgi:hypothetical protein